MGMTTSTDIIQQARQAAFTYVKEHQHLEPELGDSLKVWIVTDISTRSSKVSKVLENNGFVEHGDTYRMLNPAGLWYGTEDLRARAAEVAAEILTRELRLEFRVVRESQMPAV